MKTKQKTYYVREDLARVISTIASRAGVTESSLVGDVFIHYIESTLTPEEQRIFRYSKERKHAARPRVRPSK